MVKGLWAQSKWVLILSVLGLTHYASYTSGQKSILRENAKEQSTQVLQERKKGSDAVKRASTDTSRLNQLEKENEELLRKLDAIPERVLCPIPDDELRVLQEIVDSTK